ncbi:MAG: hypothetical protein HXY25_07690 [Alphaproteobacteria bacterium]|nr:hypothetical protein [Alphaproteobacteria bacterium]
MKSLGPLSLFLSILVIFLGLTGLSSGPRPGSDDGQPAPVARAEGGWTLAPALEETRAALGGRTLDGGPGGTPAIRLDAERVFIGRTAALRPDAATALGGLPRLSGDGVIEIVLGGADGGQGLPRERLRALGLLLASSGSAIRLVERPGTRGVELRFKGVAE